MNLDQILASSCRRKILRVLFKVDSTNIMDLVRKVNSTYNQVNPNLCILKNRGIITEQRFRRYRIIRLEKTNHQTKLLIQILRILDSEDKEILKFAESLSKNNK